ncbi:MAG: hypothetical protein HC919_14820 [Oscillatoriales cyanobacterium SM2_2_1]|nr:hypothetical protein [Oscillatoriales cyanobacterium SM2_2_1]
MKLIHHRPLPDPAPPFWVMLCNCCGDSTVLSDMLEQAPSLMTHGYGQVLGLRDVYPLPYSKLSQLERTLRTTLQREGKSKIPMAITLAVLELEAWFIAEWHHFAVLDPDLTPERIQEELGFDPRTESVEHLSHPADFLRQIYRLVGLSYHKRRNEVVELTRALDFAHLCGTQRERVPYLGRLLEILEEFFRSGYTAG